jgi:hypothetical protein
MEKEMKIKKLYIFDNISHGTEHSINAIVLKNKIEPHWCMQGQIIPVGRLVGVARWHPPRGH